MAEKFIETRIQMKRDTASAWTSATGFRPLEGEYIFYTDLNKVKIGKKDKDGNLILLSELPFLDARDADTLDGKHASEFALKSTVPTSFAPVDAEKNVQADWNETNTSSDAFIKNKPNIVLEGDARLTDARTPKAHNQAATTITEDTTHRFVTDTEKATWSAKSNFSGNYNDLTNRPTIPMTLPANGGNADTVDSKHAEDFVQSVKIGTTEYKSGATVTLPAYPTKSSLGLSNVTNDAQVKRSEMGVANGIATLGSDGKVPTIQLPASLALGTTASTAYYGDKGKIAYDHSQTTHAPANAQKNSDITKAEIEAKLTGTITSHSHSHAVTPAAGTNNTQIATTAFVKTEVNNLISSGSAEPSANTVSQYYFKYN